MRNSLIQGLRPYVPFLLVLAFATSLSPDWSFQLLLLSRMVAFAWTVHIVNRFMLGGGLSRSLGLKPRTLVGLPCILTCHFLHDCGHDSNSRGHIFYNTFGFLFTGWLLLLNGIVSFYAVSLFVMVAAGGLTWLLGRSSSCHFGASGIIYGYTGFLLANGPVSQDLYGWIATFAVVLDNVRQTILGLRPGQVGVSWEMHLYGFLGGIVAALQLENLHRGFIWLEWQLYLQGLY